MKKLGVYLFVLFTICILTANISKADDVLDDFHSQISNIESNISSKSLDLNLARIRHLSQQKRERLEISYRGRVPADVQQDSYRAEDALNKAENEFKAIEGDINSLKSEIVKYYKGKTPKKLKKEIDDLLISYYKQKLDDLNKYNQDQQDVLNSVKQ